MMWFLFAPWTKSYDKPKKQRHYFANKTLYNQRCSFSNSHVWMWELDHKEAWVSKNWCFWTVLLKRLLRVLWAARSNQSILKEINPEYSLEGLMLKMKLKYLGHLMWRANSEKILMLGKNEGRRREQQRMEWLDGITDSADMSLGISRRWWRTGKSGVLPSIGCKELDTTEWLNNNIWCEASQLVKLLISTFFSVR